MSAVDEAERLVPWIEPNTVALQWEPLEEAVLRALDTPVPAHLNQGLPLLRFANGDAPIPLLEALIDNVVDSSRDGRSRRPRTTIRCDVFGSPMTEPNTLWVPCGASVVQVTMRNFARGLLEDLTTSVAGGTPHHSLVWN